MSTPPTAYGCAQFEAVLSDYREGTLAAPVAALARAHVAQCAACAALVAAVAEMQAQVAALGEWAPPERLVGNILAQTLPPHRPLLHGPRLHGNVPQPRRLSGWAQIWAQTWASISSPRFALGVAMSVFAFALLLNAAQINLAQLFRSGGASVLSPASLTSALTRRANRTFARTWARGVTYYHDLRVVYEIEAAIHQMQQTQPPAAGGPAGRNRSRGAGHAAPELAATFVPPSFGRTLQ